MTLREELRREGFLLLSKWVDDCLIKEIYFETRKVFAYQIERVTGKNINIDEKSCFESAMFSLFKSDTTAFIHTGRTAQNSISLHRLAVCDAVMDLLKTTGLSDPVLGVRPSIQFNSRFLSLRGSKHWKLDPHQDWRTGQGSLDSVVLWIPLVPVNSELGALELIPGSHKFGLLEADDSGYQGGIQRRFSPDDFVQMPMEPGDVLLFSSLLVHRSGNNTTKNIRWSVQLRYSNLAESTYIRRGYPMAYDYKPQKDLITPNFPSDDDLKLL